MSRSAVRRAARSVFLFALTTALILGLPPYARAEGDPGPTLTFAPTLPSASVGTAYEQPLTHTAGTGPFVWSVSVGTLPAGLRLESSSGVLSGLPTEGGGSEFTVRIVDALGRSDTRAAELFVRGAPAVQLSVDEASVRFGTRVELTAALDDTGATGTVDFSVSTPQGDVVDVGSSALVAGRATLTLSPTVFGRNEVTATYTGDARHLASRSTPVAVEVSAYEGQVVISEFRTSGPDGPADQYVELYNRGPALPLAGLQLQSTSGTTVTLPADAPVLETFRTYLLAAADFSLSSLATPDHTVGDLGAGGFRLVAPDTARTVIEAVGPASGFHLGSGLPEITGVPTQQWAFVRTETGGRPDDTRDNRSDFALVSTSGGTVGGLQSMRGSASPTGLRDAWQHNRQVLSFRLDSTRTPAQSPNREYVVSRPGTLELRRTLTNTGVTAIVGAKVRITAISEADGLPYRGAAPTRPARLRVVDPQVATSQVSVADRGTVIVHHLSVDAPITSASGGGLNSTLTVPLPGGELAPGASVDVAVTFEVDTRGTFWFGYDVDARTTAGPAGRRSTADGAETARPLRTAQGHERLRRAGLTREQALTRPDTGRL